ncbi:MAG: teichoic acid transporter [Deltaproteobacteria bacterium]|nr:teichoic acid transporter [Deltaproteobacteria bacterium]
MTGPEDPLASRGADEDDSGSEDVRGVQGWLADGPLRRLLANASLLIGGRSLNGLFNLAAMTLIVRAVGLETFGSLVLVHAFANTIGDLAKFQSWQAVLRYGTPALEAERFTDFRRLVKLTVMLDLGSALFGIGAAWVAAPLLAPHLGWPPTLVPVVQIYSLSILFMVTATPTGLLRLFDRFDLLSVSNAMGSLVRLVGAVWIFFRGGDLEFLLALWFSSVVVNGLWLIGHSIRALSARELLRGPRLGYRGLASGHERIASFVLTTHVNTTLSASMRHLATLVVGSLLGPAGAGLYDVSRQVTTLLTRLARLMKPAIYPEFARLSARNDMPGIRQLLLRSMALMTATGAVLVLPFVLFGRTLLGFVFGQEVEAAYALVVWMALAAAIRLLAFPLEPALISTGRAGTALVVRATTVTVFLTCLFTLIPRIGLIGSGVATLAAAIVALAGQGLSVSAWFRGRKAGAT